MLELGIHNLFFKKKKVQRGKKSLQIAFHQFLFCTLLWAYTSSTLNSKKALLIKQQKLTKSKFSTLCQIPFRCFIFVQKNGELAFLHLKAGSEHCIPGRVRGKPYIKRKIAKPMLLKQSKSREISIFLTMCRLWNISLNKNIINITVRDPPL